MPFERKESLRRARRLDVRSKRTRPLWSLWQILWGFPQTLTGFLLARAHASCPRSSYQGERIVYWDRNQGMSLGLFLFIPVSEHARIEGLLSRDGTECGPAADAGCKGNTGHEGDMRHAGREGIVDREGGWSAFVLKHEYGHAVQSAILGPLYLLVVGVPSLIWSNLPALKRWRMRTGYDYYRFVVERTASWLGKADRPL